jgi:hypothetical protein
MFLDKTQWFAESDFLANLIGKSNHFFQKKPISKLEAEKPFCENGVGHV